jgi:regulator of RNase E activity RraA
MAQALLSRASWASLRQRLLTIDCCSLCDASSKKARVIDTVRPLKLGYKMAGVARTVSIRGDFLGVLHAIRDASAGEVLMIDAGLDISQRRDEWPATGGMFGELLALEAQRKGLAGLVIDGNVRDTAAQRTLDIPIYSRGVHPNAGTATEPGKMQEPVQLAGVVVRPGDLVVGDDDGVVVATESELEAWLPAAEQIQQREAEIFGAVQQGTPLLELHPINELGARLPH